MPITSASRAARRPWLSLCALLMLVMSPGTLGAATVADGAATAVSKKKCEKKNPRKCAPRGYHLSASGTVDNRSSTYVETWSAEVELARRFGIFGIPALDKANVFYVQDSGTVTLGFSGQPDCAYPGPAWIDVPMQTVPVHPVAEPRESDFVVAFHLHDKTYGGQTGTRYGTIFASGTKNCPTEDGGYESTPVTFAHVGSVLNPSSPGKVGGTHSGSWSYVVNDFEHHFVQWKLTPTK